MNPECISAEEAASLLRRVLSGEIAIRLLDDVDFKTAYINQVLFSVGATDSPWMVSIFNDCGEVDYIDFVVDPIGRQGDFDAWAEELRDLCIGAGPLDLLSEDERSRLDSMIFALSPCGRPKCNKCGTPGQLFKSKISFPCGCKA